MESGTMAPRGAGERQPAQGRTRHHEIVIVGGGTGGLSVAARLRRKGCGDVAIIEPSEDHYYQPFWTLVGAGVVPKEASRRAERDYIPKGVYWLEDAATAFEPEANLVLTASGERVAYDYLVVAPGLQLNWSAVKGLEGNVGRNGICSNYAYDQCERTWETIKSFDGGTALFTMPSPPIKCAGAPQKIMYLADDAFRKVGVRDRSRVVYASATPGIFAVKEFAATLEKVIARKGIETYFRHELIEVKPDVKQAVFRRLEYGDALMIDYDMIHVTPPQGPPDFIRASPLADGAGWVEVDKHTTQHTRYPNVFSLGDASSLPTSKTGAAIRKEAPVLVENLLAQRAGRPLTKSYDGYSSCPLTTGYGKLVLAEFDYDLKPAPSIPLIDTTKERWSMYQLKRYGLPAMYWAGMLRGRM